MQKLALVTDTKIDTALSDNLKQTGKECNKKKHIIIIHTVYGIIKAFNCKINCSLFFAFSWYTIICIHCHC